jgi:hypothetical protein
MFLGRRMMNLSPFSFPVLSLAFDFPPLLPPPEKSGAFFSNSRHVDPFRASCARPWALSELNPATIRLLLYRENALECGSTFNLLGDGEMEKRTRLAIRIDDLH